MGGVYAVANLRGGGEFGEEWHLAGARAKKQNVFDDFIAAAEHLRERGYTSPEKLVIEGASNGGLLVGAVITQRPELFGAALADVGVLDMLRYHLPSLNARQWADDYGRLRERRGFPRSDRLLAAAQREAGHLLSADAGHHRRPRRSRGALAQLQVRGRAAEPPSPATTRCCSRSRPGSGTAPARRPLS